VAPIRGRARRGAALLGCGALLLGLCAADSPLGLGGAYFPLDSSTLAVGPAGTVTRVFQPSELVPGSRVLASAPDSAELARNQRDWLAAGRVPTVPELAGSSMVRDALLDLHVLSEPYGVAVAGHAPAWRYVWPRDSALVATALARTGHLEDADRILDFLGRVQPAAGPFQARYHADGSGVPDDRGPQTDSLGWVLWALGEVSEALPVEERREFVRSHRGLLDTSVRASLALLDRPGSLPPPSADYWETTDDRLTLSTAALLHAGLVAAGPLYEVLGAGAGAAEATAARDRLATAIHQAFGADGYPRTLGGSAADVDLGVSFLLPPFAEPRPAVAQAWRASTERLIRPAGGLAPGGSWRRDGVSWTTATSSNALTAAALGDRASAVQRLRWLDAHRTSAGSLPEKVLADGSPASVAPLAWAAAAVVIAVTELEGPAALEGQRFAPGGLPGAAPGRAEQPRIEGTSGG
jgi:hypothetical protein